MVIWVKKCQTQLMVEIYPKSLVTAIGKKNEESSDALISPQT